MKYIVKPSTKFAKDLKVVQKRGYNISLIDKVMKNCPKNIATMHLRENLSAVVNAISHLIGY